MSNNDEITDYKKLRDDMDRISAKLWEKESINFRFFDV